MLFLVVCYKVRLLRCFWKCIFSLLLQLNTSACRLLVQESVAEKLTRKLCRRLEKVRVGSSMDKNHDVASLTMDGQVEAIKQVVEEARQEGAQVGLHAAHVKTLLWYLLKTYRILGVSDKGCSSGFFFYSVQLQHTED